MKIRIILLLLIITITSCSNNTQDISVKNIESSNVILSENKTEWSITISKGTQANEFIDISILKDKSENNTNAFITTENNELMIIDMDKKIENPKFDIETWKIYTNDVTDKGIKGSFN
jgi:hypothetical protein